MIQEINIKMSQADLELTMETFVKKHAKESVIKEFTEERDSKVAMGILGIKEDTLTKYIKTKRLIPIRGDQSKYTFRLSDILIALKNT